MRILDLRKTLIYDFCYNHTKKIHDHKPYLLFLDITSLIYEIKRNDLHVNFHKNKDKYDFNSYPNNSKIYDKTNKMEISKIKDEAEGVLIVEYSGLICKMYSVKKGNGAAPLLLRSSVFRGALPITNKIFY